MKKIIVASKNGVKIEAAAGAFAKMFPEETFEIQSIEAPSGIGEQPLSNNETLQGAHNRVTFVRDAVPLADFWIAFEGGVEDTEEGMTAFAWAAVESKEGLYGKGRSATFFLPPRVASLIREGKTLGEADDLVFGMTNSSKSSGAIGILTKNLVTRAAYSEGAAVLALIPFKNPELY